MIRGVQMTPTVLLLHGFTHTGSSWEPVIAALGERYRALAPDLRGHGSAGVLTPVNLDAVLGDLEPLLEPGPVTVVGYSMGGRIALHLALSRPEHIERLILIGASPGIAEAAEREERRRADEALADEIERSGIEEFASRWAQTPILRDLPPAIQARAHTDRLRNAPTGLARALQGLGTGALPTLWDRLGELRMPVFLVVGERDQKFREIAGRMAKAIRRSEIVVVPGAGHAVHLVAPQRVAEMIRSPGR
jgi:2-succinyl-6-hydroxy-2,4-cyclohexadiene-1-carboxylate synthase